LERFPRFHQEAIKMHGKWWRRVARRWLEARRTYLFWKRKRLEENRRSLDEEDQAERHKPAWVRELYIAADADFGSEIWKVNKRISAINTRLETLG
jgi:hypothetical protein